MKNLSSNAIVSLRKNIEEKLLEQVKCGNMKEGDRIHIEKSVLEDLLFDDDQICIEVDFFVKVKSPVWSGEFLAYIDLSEISFRNVYWKTVKVVYKNTNAKISFIAPFEEKNPPSSIQFYGGPSDFSGTFLGDNKIPIDLISVVKYGLNFANTKVAFVFEDFPDKMTLEEKQKIKNKFHEMLFSDMFLTCTINGETVTEDEAKKESLFRHLMFVDMAEKVLLDIEDEVARFKKEL